MKVPRICTQQQKRPFLMQTKKQSATEAGLNILIGYLVAVISQMVIFPLVGVQATITQNITIGIYFTVISFCRSYLVRRYFNKGERL